MKKAAASLALAAVILRAIVLCTGESLAQSFTQLLDGDRLVSAAVALELGASRQEPTETQTLAVSEPAPVPALSLTPDPTPVPVPAEEQPEESVQAGGVSARTRALLAVPSVGLTNRTDYSVELSSLAQAASERALDADGPQILILHTHSTEAYTPDAADPYEESDPYRTLESDKSVIRVGEELASGLEACGLTVLHDTNLYDYPSYTGSYTRAGEAMEAWLAAYPQIGVVIDVHRDAIENGDVVYKTRAELDGRASAQAMLVVGTDASGLNHPCWRENLGLAALLQGAAENAYPTLMRDMELVPQRYNQHLSVGCLLLEVGSSGNTLSEALTAARLFAESAGPVLAELLSEAV